MSNKRRRGIGFRKWLVDALKDYAKRKGLKSHTTATRKILRGKLPPIPSYEKYKNDDCTKQGVSMQEELWLALKIYSKSRGRGESDTQVACKIIVGKIAPIPDRCIEEGKRQARKREESRALNPTESKGKKKAKKKAKKRVKGTDEEKGSLFSESEIEKAEKEIAKKDGEGASDLNGSSGLPPGVSSREFLDSVKDESKERKILEERAEEKRDESGRKLSRGEPLDEAHGSKDREIDPDDDHYGGVFNL